MTQNDFPNTLKTMSYNIHKGQGPAGLRFTLPEIREFLRLEAADIVFLQEAVGEHKGKKLNIDGFPNNNQVEYLAEDLYPYMIYGGNKHHRLGHHGNAILSRYPLEKVENHNISQNRFESRGLLHVTLDYHSEEIHLFNTHLNLLEKDRQKQIKWIQKHLDHELSEHHPVILAGDFNDWRRRIIDFLHQETALKEVFGNEKFDNPHSFPSFLPRLSLDRIFYKNLKLHEAVQFSGKKFKRLSDHLPLLAHFLV